MHVIIYMKLLRITAIRAQVIFIFKFIAHKICAQDYIIFILLSYYACKYLSVMLSNRVTSGLTFSCHGVPGPLFHIMIYKFFKS